MTTEESIEQFIRYFLDQMDNIATLQVPRYPTAQRLYDKILYVILLDTLSIAAAPTLANRNRERFLNLIHSCAMWTDESRVSAQQLKLDLERRKLDTGNLYQHVAGIVGTWVEGAVLGPNSDPTEMSLRPRIKGRDEARVVSDNRYDSLLYVYRNNLLHEFREPGYGIEFPGHAQPFYHSMMSEPWQLTFPLEFFRRLCLSSIWGLRTLLFAEKRDPHDAYPFGSSWRPARP